MLQNRQEPRSVAPVAHAHPTRADRSRLQADGRCGAGGRNARVALILEVATRDDRRAPYDVVSARTPNDVLAARSPHNVGAPDDIVLTRAPDDVVAVAI